MKELYLKALQSYIKMLEIHINTKTQDPVFHEKTEEFYEWLFKVAHEIWEKHIDLWWSLKDSDVDSQKEEALNTMKELLNEIEQYKDNNEVTLWSEDLLWSLANDIENMIWTAKSFKK